MDTNNEPKQDTSTSRGSFFKSKGFITRLITCVVLISILIVAVALGKWVLSVFTAGCLFLGIYEELKLLNAGGYHPVWWISFVGLALSYPIMFFLKPIIMIPLFVMLAFFAILCVIRRKEPLLIDLLMTLLPLLSIAFPGACLFRSIAAEPDCLSRFFFIFTLAAAITGDTAAYLVGSRVGGAKLCPAISPKKTISGSIGGLLGSIIAAIVVWLCFRGTISAVMEMPPLWVCILCGFFAGIAGQLGDLLASMVKRCCGAKDFSNIFPGHGGMMDRIDSILLAAVIVYSFQLIFF